MSQENVGKVALDLGINHKAFNRELNSIAGNAERMVGGAFKKLGLIVAGAFAIGKLVSFGKAAIGLASDLSEVQNVVDVTFGAMAADINQFSKDALYSFGMSELSAKRFSSTMGAMLKSSGLSGNAVTTLSKDMTALAGDMASFYNLKHEEAFDKIRSGISGQTEPLKQLGINMSVANLEAFALSQGIKKSYQKMSQAEQVMLRYNYLMSVTADAQGDFARTSDSWANQTRILTEQWKIFQGTMGQGFINILTPVVRGLNRLIQKLQIAAQYFKAFTELIFGVAKPAAQGVAAVADAGSAVGGAMDDVATGVKKAGKAVKGSLSGFDVLNVVGQTAAGSLEDLAEGIGGGMDGIDLGSLTTGSLDLGGAEIDAFKDKLLSLLQPLSKINLIPLKDAFTKLKTAIEPFTEKLFSGVRWAYDNVLLPLGKWTIENAVPAFLDAVSGALDFLNPVLESFKPLFSWFWDHVLKPIAEWTGGLVVDILKAIGIVLSDIGTWMSDNQSVVDKMTTSVVLFFGAWKLTEVMGFIQMSGGLVAAFGRITKAIKACTVAKIADKLETMHIHALFAKDFVVSLGKAFLALLKNTGAWLANTATLIANKVAMIASTVAQGALTLATTIWNGVCAVAAAVTTAFGAALAFLTSPIGLIILAVAALVAGIILLYKNWDTVKEKASEVWQGIKNVWAKASEWFNTKVVSPIRELFSGLGEGISNTFKGAINKIIDGINWLIRGLNKIKFDLPDWIPGIGGKSLGINIAEIPKLAQGGLVSGPTLAMVGDNRNARVDPEVVTPLSKLQDMLGASNQVMVEVLFAILEAIERLDLNVDIDGERLTRIIREKLQAENNRVGKSMVVIGGATS